MDRRRTVAVDFDGVIHSYTSPWVDHHTIPDVPIPGAIEWLSATTKHFNIVIFTTRGATADGQRAVHEWLRLYGYTGPALEVTNVKPPALIYLDDRALRFEGTFPTRNEIHALKPWKIQTTEEAS